MNETSNTIWTWEEVNPNHSGTSGDLAKMFRNEPVKAPGVFAKDQPSPEATVMAREVIQNAWDAALEFRADEEHPPPQFENVLRSHSKYRLNFSPRLGRKRTN